MEGKLDKGISKVLTTMWWLRCDINSKDFDSLNELTIQLQDDIDLLLLDVVRAENECSVDKAEIDNAKKVIEKAYDIIVEANKLICEVEIGKAYDIKVEANKLISEKILLLVNSSH